MDTLKILYMYPDILELYGDYGNIQILKYRLESRGLKCEITPYSIGDNEPEFSDFDIVFAGGGADLEQSVLSSDLIKLKNKISKAVEEGVFFLLICGAYQLFGKYYKNTDGEIIPGLEIFEYYTVANPNRGERCIGNIIINISLNNENIKIIGFENHGGQTFNVATPFGEVLIGNGNTFENANEGFFRKNIIATYLHGPLLSKNPELADYIIKYCFNRKNYSQINLIKLNDEFEAKCRQQLIARFLGD